MSKESCGLIQLNSPKKRLQNFDENLDTGVEPEKRCSDNFTRIKKKKKNYRFKVTSFDASNLRYSKN